MLLRRQKGETASFHMLTSLSAPRTDGQTHISAQREEGKRGIQSHTIDAPSTPPTLFASTPLLHSSPTLSFSFILFHLFKSLHFRCIHTFPISLCMSLPPSSSPPLVSPFPPRPFLSCLSILPSFLPSFFPIFLPPSLPPSHYCNPSLFHQPPCKQASWLP